MTGRIPGVPEDWATACTKAQDEVARLGTIIVNAHKAMVEGRRGDALKMLKHAFPQHPVPGGPMGPTGGGRVA
jgi:hypothetical protein